MEVNVSPLERISTNENKIRQLIKDFPQSVETVEKSAAKVASEFEALFVGLMLKSMRSADKGEAVIDGGKGGDLYRSLLDQEYAKTIAESGSLGLAKIIRQELVKTNMEQGVEKCAMQSLQTPANKESRGTQNEN